MAKRARSASHPLAENEEDHATYQAEAEGLALFSPSKRRHVVDAHTSSDTNATSVSTMEHAATAAGARSGKRSNRSEAQEEDEASERLRAQMELQTVFVERAHAGANDANGDADADAVGRAIVNAVSPVTASMDAHDHVQAVGTGDSITDTHSPSITAADAAETSTPMVIAPMFTPVHRSWEEFEHSLKEYAQATYQLYVIRTTTSVKRRNLRITENASTAGASVAPGVTYDTGGEDEEAAGASGAPSATAAPRASSSESDQLLIPESYQWYSKTLMCTHGWKDRNRGSGKRALAVVRSTSCPAKMCVTLQHRGKGHEGWQVVLTRHVRTHNHQLSKELYLYYMENRRIYDPDLLVVPTPSTHPSTGRTTGAAVPTQHQQRNRSGLSHLLTNNEGSQSSPQYASREMVADNADSVVTGGDLAGDGDADPASHAIFRAPKVLVKVHDSWEDFHKYVAEYSAATEQSFRARSTVSVAAKNAKTKSLALKAGRGLEEIQDQAIPEEERWYSKMLICNHGWKRKSRSKAPKSHLGDGASASNVCPAILLARLQRDVNNNWRVVINRQVLEHNHSLTPERSVPTPSASSLDSRSVSEEVAEQEPSSHTVLHFFGGDATGNPSDGQDAENEEAHEEEREHRPDKGEVVVRVPKLEIIHTSWEAFHARLQEYSDATFQLYRTRTTSSVQGRNQKIPDMKRISSAANAATNSEGGKPSDARVIPDKWKWYSKTLTCTHGWKERRRGTGKRTVQVFRSTSCPVKICATVQFVENAEDPTDPSSNSGGWRVVVTKHVVDHNHNLSKELHQHYCENRRIYDPDLLAIDESNEGAVVKPRVAHSFVLGSEVSPFFPQGAAGFTHSSGINAVSEPSAGLAQAPGNGLHPLTLMAGVSSHPEQTNVNPSLSAEGIGRRSNADGSTAPVISFTSAFPSVAGSHALFPTAGSQQASPYLLHPHHYVAADPTASSILASAISHLPSMEMSHGSSGGTNSATIANTTGTILLAPCRVHGSSVPHAVGAEVLSPNRSAGSSDQCTCFRVVNSGNHNPLKSRPRHARAVEASSMLPASEGTAARRRTNDRTTRADAEDEGNEDEPDEEPTGGIVWSPTSPAEIVTIPADFGTNIWRAPRIKRLHDTWDAFQEHLDGYSVATFQLYRVRTTSSVSSRNARIAQQATAREMPIPAGSAESAPSPRFVPETYQWYSKTFVCTHGWKERRRGKGQRVSHSLRSTECSAKLCVTLQKPAHETDSNTWRVVVTRQTTDHNHEISVQAYQQYSENRRIKDASLLEQAEELWKKGLTRRKIYDFLKEQSPNAILMKDVHNLVQRWQAPRQSGTIEEAAAGGDDGTPALILSSPASAATAATESSSADLRNDQSVLHELHDI